MLKTSKARARIRDVLGRCGLRQGGFSVLEMVISTGMLTLVMGGIVMLLNGIQKGRITQLDVAEMQQNQRYAMDCLLRQSAGAGNDPLGIGITAFDMDPLGNGQHSAVRIVSDCNPPNGVATDPLENVLFALSGSTLTMQDAATGSTTEVAQNISGVLYEFFDASGNAASSSANIARLRVTLTGTSTRRDPQTGLHRSFTLTDEAAVRNSAALGGGAGSPVSTAQPTTTVVTTTTAAATTTTTSSITTTTCKKMDCS